MAILDDAKASLHITNTANDSDMTDVIEACKLDLKKSGVTITEESDPLIKQAVKLYCRSYFNYMGEGERWQKSYDGLRDSMALCGDYNTAVVTA